MRRLMILGLLAALALPATAPAQQAAHTAAVAERVVAQHAVPGIVVVYARGDDLPNIAAAGRIAEGDAPAADIDSLWRVYSMTKPITAIAAMILIEEGKMRLDQPVSDFIPAFKNMRVLVDPARDLTSRPAKRPITVRNLLTHTAGLGYTIVTKGPLLDAYNKAGITPYTANAGFEAQARPMRPATLRAFADRVATLPLIADPGTQWSYSIGLDVMGAVIEVATGMPFDRFVQTRIFDPLRMRSSYWTVPASEAKRLATSYMALGTNRVPVDPGASSVWLRQPSFPFGGAGLVMSARDYDRFLHMLQNGGTLDGARILKPETVKLAMSDLLPPGVDKSLLKGVAAGHMGFGAGGSVTLADVPGGPARGTYGWSGAAGTNAFVDPASGIRGTMMINVLGDESIRRDVTAAIYADLRR